MRFTQLPPTATGQAGASLIACQRRPSHTCSATKSGSSLASSGAGLLTRGDEGSGGRQREARPVPQTDTSGGGGGRGPRRRLGYSGDGGHEDGSSGYHLPWDRLFGCAACHTDETVAALVCHVIQDTAQQRFQVAAMLV